jgi:Protein of unknown function (DUF2530)
MSSARRERRRSAAAAKARVQERAQQLREQGQLLKPAEPHEFGRPEVTEHEFGNRRYLVAQVEPLDVDGTRTVGVGSLLWLVALVALLPFYSTLESSGRLWWLWTCLAGFGWGMVGLEYCRRRRRTLRGR